MNKKNSLDLRSEWINLGDLWDNLPFAFGDLKIIRISLQSLSFFYWVTIWKSSLPLQHLIQKIAKLSYLMPPTNDESPANVMKLSHTMDSTYSHFYFESNFSSSFANNFMMVSHIHTAITIKIWARKKCLKH